MSNFDYPKCGALGKGVLLFNSVAPCDDCYGVKDNKIKGEKYTIHKHKELTHLKGYYAVALGCGQSKQVVVECLSAYPPDGDYGYDTADSQYIPIYADRRAEEYCVVQWSE